MILNPTLLPSSYNRFPNEYKFLGMEYKLSMNVANTERETLSLFDYLGDLGGLAEILLITAGLFVHRFSRVRLNALMINRLFHISNSDEHIGKLMDKLVSSNGEKQQKVIKRPNGDIVLGVPDFLACELFTYWILCCCRNVRGMKHYSRAV